MTTASPFDAPEPDAAAEATHLVLRNAQGAHSLWPVFRDPPQGWERVHGPATHGSCVAYLQEAPA
ncbi:MbtH family NRPS accessory protein [Streptomyces sp. NPDC004111]|uniref:MbtH family NRPS accessory protein n=1 Tax=Streptomyces sp. NPDC004111 TaxID=3364690 RepID=UPI0036874F8A